MRLSIVPAPLVLLLATPPPAEVFLVAGEGLHEPFGVDFDRSGKAYIVEMGGHRVSVLDRDMKLSVLAGTGEKGFAGDGGPAGEARFNGPHHLLVGPEGDLYVADTWNHCVRKIDLSTRVVTRVAGTGDKGFSYICERAGHAVRVVDPAGRIRTVAGTGEPGLSGDGGPAREARLNGPKHISVDADDSVLIADTENHVIRRYSPRDGTIRRVAGTGRKGSAGPGGPAETCELNRPHGAQVHPATGAIWVSDSDNHRVIRIER